MAVPAVRRTLDDQVILVPADGPEIALTGKEAAELGGRLLGEGVSAAFREAFSPQPSGDER